MLAPSTDADHPSRFSKDGHYDSRHNDRLRCSKPGKPKRRTDRKPARLRPAINPISSQRPDPDYCLLSSRASAMWDWCPALDTAFTNACPLAGVDALPERMLRNIMWWP